MSHAHRTQRPPRRGDKNAASTYTNTPRAAVTQTPLGDDRFQALLSSAHAFFAQAEQDEVAQRLAVINDIKARMAEYGLTVDDLER